MGVPTHTLDSIIQNSMTRAYNDKLIENQFYQHLETELKNQRKNDGVQLKKMLQKVEAEGIQKISTQNTSLDKKLLVIKHYQNALYNVAVHFGVQNILSRAFLLKLKMQKLNKAMLEARRRRLRAMRIEKMREAEEEEMEEIKYEEDALRREAEKKKLEEEGYKLLMHPIDIALALTENISYLNDSLVEALATEGVDINIPKGEQEKFKNIFLELELELRKPLRDMEMFGKKLTTMVEGFEDMYENIKKAIDPKNIKAIQVLDRWCESVENNLLSWLECGNVKTYDAKQKADIHKDWKVVPQAKGAEKQGKLFTPLLHKVKKSAVLAKRVPDIQNDNNEPRINSSSTRIAPPKPNPLNHN